MDFNKPRVAMYYNVLPSTGMRNDGANLFLFYNFKKLLDGVDAYGNPSLIQNDTGNIVALSPIDPTSHYGKFDLNLLVDYGEDALGIPLDWELPHPSAYWVSDAHIGYDYRLKRAKQMDYVFVAQKAFIDQFVRDGIPREKIHYLPHAAESMCYKPFPVMEKWDWCFIGHLSNEFRIDLVDRFCKEWPLGEHGYLGWRQSEWRGYNVLEDAAKKFSQSRIVLNESIKDDLNMRTLEALACKRLLLTEEVSDMRDHFKNGVHLVMFKTVDEAVEMARHFLNEPEKRNAIAEAGYNEFLSKHTYMHRCKEILKVCLNYESPEIKGELIHAH